MKQKRVTDKEISAAGRLLALGNRQRRMEHAKESASAHFRVAAGQTPRPSDAQHLPGPFRELADKLRDQQTWDALTPAQRLEVQGRGLGPNDFGKSPTALSNKVRKIEAYKNRSDEAVAPVMRYRGDAPVQKTSATPNARAPYRSSAPFWDAPNTGEEMAKSIEGDVDAELHQSPVETGKAWKERRQAEIADRFEMAQMMERRDTLNALRRKRSLTPAEIAEDRRLDNQLIARETIRSANPGKPSSFFPKDMSKIVSALEAENEKADAAEGRVVDRYDRAERHVWETGYQPREFSGKEWHDAMAGVNQRRPGPPSSQGAVPPATGAQQAHVPSLPPSVRPLGMMDRLRGWFPGLVKAVGSARGLPQAGKARGRHGGASAATALATHVGKMLSSLMHSMQPPESSSRTRTSHAWRTSKSGKRFYVSGSGKRVYESQHRQGAAHKPASRRVAASTAKKGVL